MKLRFINTQPDAVLPCLTWSHSDVCGVFVNNLDFVGEAVLLHDALRRLGHRLKNLQESITKLLTDIKTPQGGNESMLKESDQWCSPPRRNRSQPRPWWPSSTGGQFRCRCPARWPSRREPSLWLQQPGCPHSISYSTVEDMLAVLLFYFCCQTRHLLYVLSIYLGLLLVIIKALLRVLREEGLFLQVLPCRDRAACLHSRTWKINRWRIIVNFKKRIKEEKDKN